MLWFQAMFCIAPLLLISSFSGAGKRVWWRGTEPKLRAWAAMLCASFIAYAMHPVEGDMPFIAFACIDFLAGMAVLSSPSGIYSRLIGGLFFVMLLLEGAFGYAGHPGGGAYNWAMDILGFLMVGILVWWGAHDAGNSLAARSGSGGGARNVGAAIASARQGSTGVIEP